jgi:hypothetical protein
MHPEIMRELTAQRGRDLQVRAYRAQLARTLSRELRARRHRGGQPAEAELAGPAIPDYVDGSFRTAEEQPASRVPAARHAA